MQAKTYEEQILSDGICKNELQSGHICLINQQVVEGVGRASQLLYLTRRFRWETFAAKGVAAASQLLTYEARTGFAH